MENQDLKEVRKKDAVKQLQEKPAKDEFLIVGIGASAGGIQALQEFFRHVPQHSGMAYVVILHLSPDHDSQLASVLQTTTKISVTQVTEKVRIRPDHIYVVPPNQHLTIENDFIVVSKNLLVEERRAPVDIFFRTLADEHGPRAIAIILSGTGANGSMGIKRIKERGGACFVQNPREAEFSEMPRNSIATELVDEVLPVADIPAKIASYKTSLGKIEITEEAEKRPEAQQHALREVFTQIRVKTGHDFSNYKRPTLLRRIERRINVRSLPDLPAYSKFLQENPDETTALLKDLLISVTNFYRDKKPFDVIEQEVLPMVFKSKTSEDQVRIWVAGCATGEEAYSIAMLCAERTMGAVDAPNVQIFATDIDEAAIAQAREGLYTLNDAADVSPERLRRFFNKENDCYRIRREIREMILFAQHNFLKDPPFSHLDMVSCRNVMIYLNHVAQERVIETFHFALNPGGYLFLGTSESVDGASDLYAVYNRENHIFQSRQVLPRAYPIPESSPALYSDKFKKNYPSQEQENKILERISFGDLHQQLLEEYAPPSLVVNEEHDIVHLTERAGRYLQVSGGELSQNLLNLVKPELRLELRSALYQAAQRQAAIEARGLKVKIDDKPETVNIHLRPVLRSGHTAKGYILVIFEPTSDGDNNEILLSPDEPVARQLEEELIRMKAQARSSNEQHDFQAEELKASNEELQAMNEELRSAAEELETSKEELQSINEELRTVNQELKVKIEETSIASNNLNNLINSTDIGTIFLDRSFRVALYTPAAGALFNLIPADYGRPLTDITHKLDYQELLSDAETVLEKLNAVEKEVRTHDGKTYLMRLTPYRTDEDRIKGVVITFLDITERKKTEKALQQVNERMRLIVESAKDYAIFTTDRERRVVSWSSGAEIITGYSAAEMSGKRGDIIFTPEDLENGAPEEEAEKAEKAGRAENERWHVHKDGSRFWGSGSVSPLHDDEGKLMGFVKIMRDLTAMRRLEEAKFFLASIIETSNDSVITIDFKRNITSWNKAAEELYGYTAEEAIGKNLSMLTLPGDFLEVLYRIDTIERSREVAVFDSVRHNKKGELKQLEIVMSPVLNTAGDVIGISTIARDVSERKHREANLAFLAKINLDLAPLLTMQEVMQPVAEQLASHLQLSRCQFSIVDEEHDRIEVIYDYRHDEELPAMMGVHCISDGITEDGKRQYSTSKLAVMNAAAESPLVKMPEQMLSQLGFGSFIDVPHLEGGQWKFLLTAGRAEAGEWRSDEVELLQELASKIYIRIERARVEEALGKSEQRLQKALSIETVGVIYFNQDGIIHDCNVAFERMSCFSKNDLIKNTITWQDLTPPEFMEASQKAQEELLTQGQSTPYEKQYICPNGSRWWGLFAGKRLSENEFVKFVVDITAGKKAEKALGQSEERLRTLSDAVPQVIWTNTGDGKADYFNQRWYEYSGLSHEQSEDLGWQAIVHPEDAPASVEKWNKALNAGEVFDTEYRLRRHDGSYRWFIGRNVPVRNDTGKITGWFGSATDIEALKQAQEALSTSEERLRVTMESAVDYAIISTNTDRIINGWSRGAEHIFGYTAEEATGKPADLIFTPEDVKNHVPQKEMETARDTGSAPDERWHLRKNGSRFYVSGVVAPINDGTLSGYVKVARDMTEQQQAQEQLRIFEERYRIALESAQMGAWDWNVKDDQVVWNEQHHTILGIEPNTENKSADYFLKFVHADDRERITRRLMEAVETTGIYNADFRIVRADNSEVRWMIGYGSTVAQENSRATRMVGVMFDITDRKKLEQQKEDFLSIASHELKTPVTSIKVYGELLQETFKDRSDKDSEGLMQKMNAQVNRLKDLISDLLDTTKITEGQLDLNYEDFNIDELIQQLVDELQQLSQKHRLIVVCDGKKDVHADRKRIEQVISNLISNAIKYSPDGDDVTITCESFETEVKVSVMDKGIGIPEELQEKIFNRFFRVSHAKLNKFPGMGLGLYIAADIIRRHNGTIGVKSNRDKGSVFFFSLPYNKQAQHEKHNYSR